jgi:hypothetical protein
MPVGELEWQGRRNASERVLKALGLLGLDGDNLVRYGMPHRAGLPVILGLLSSNHTHLLPDLDQWREVLHLPAPHSDGSDLSDDEFALVAQAVAMLPRRLTAWAHNAPIAEIVGLSAPTAEKFDEYLLATPVSEETIGAYVWLYERSTVETLDRWTTKSLHLEHKWQDGRKVAVFPDAAMSDGPSMELLNGEIARRAVEPRDEEGEEADRLFWQLQEQAVDFLVKNKFTEAATLFEFHHRLYPGDARSLNNMGFCSLPVDPAAALNFLERAEAAGYSPRLINTYNQCCCLRALNRSAEALDRAESYWQRQREPVEPGYLWVPVEDGWSLKPDIDPEFAIACLAEAIAIDLGLPDRAARWKERGEHSVVTPAQPEAKAS